MAMTSKQIQQIYQYAKANGNFLESEKVLKEAQKHPELMWQIICKVFSQIKNKSIENAYSLMIYTLPQPQKHERSAAWLKEFMGIRDFSVQVSNPYDIMDYIKPDKDKTINFLSKLVETANGVNLIKSQFDQAAVKLDLMSKESIKCKSIEGNTRNSLVQFTEQQKSQRPAYEQKIKIIESLRQQNNQQRQDKLEVLARQKFYHDQISKEQKKEQELIFQGQSSLLCIEQIKNEIAKNAPEYKKEKIAVEEEYSRLEKQINHYLDLARSRHEKIKLGLEKRKRSKVDIIEYANKLADVFAMLDQSNLKLAKINEDNESYKRRKKNLLSLETDRSLEFKSLQIDSRNLQNSKQVLDRKVHLLSGQLMKLIGETTEFQERIMHYQETKMKLATILRDLIQKVDFVRDEFNKEEDFLQNQVTKWMTMLDRNLAKIFLPMTEVHTRLKTKRQFNKQFS